MSDRAIEYANEQLPRLYREAMENMRRQSEGLLAVLRYEKKHKQQPPVRIINGQLLWDVREPEEANAPAV